MLTLLWIYLGVVFVKTWLTAGAISGPNLRMKRSDINGLVIGIVFWPIGMIAYFLTVKRFEPEAGE